MTPSKEMLERIAAEEKELVLSSFTEEDAWRLGNILAELAWSRNLPVAVDIRRPGQIMFHAVFPGAVADNEEWVRRKTNVLFRFGQSSLAVGVSLALAGQSIEEKSFISSFEFSPHGGAFPVRVTGVGIVAAATVSGLPQEEDHALVVEALRAFMAVKGA
jgi:uncharacterized protein (UPF0303 family)